MAHMQELALSINVCPHAEQRAGVWVREKRSGRDKRGAISMNLHISGHAASHGRLHHLLRSDEQEWSVYPVTVNFMLSPTDIT